jgi:hypothetical protein
VGVKIAPKYLRIAAGFFSRPASEQIIFCVHRTGVRF